MDGVGSVILAENHLRNAHRLFKQSETTQSVCRCLGHCRPESLCARPDMRRCQHVRVSDERVVLCRFYREYFGVGRHEVATRETRKLVGFVPDYETPERVEANVRRGLSIPGEYNAWLQNYVKTRRDRAPFDRARAERFRLPQAPRLVYCALTWGRARRLVAHVG
jgi:hypothetical protein